MSGGSNTTTAYLLHTRAIRMEFIRSRLPLGHLIQFPPAMTDAQLEEIPKKTITKEEADSLIQCVLCLHEFELNDQEVRKLPCQHMYHGKCIFPWLKINPTCPLCRAPLPNQNFVDFGDFVREHFDLLTRHLGNIAANEADSDAETVVIAESQLESVRPVPTAPGIIQVEENPIRARRNPHRSASTRRSGIQAPAIRRETPAPRRAALRAREAIHQVYRSQRHPRASSTESSPIFPSIFRYISASQRQHIP